MKKAFAFSFFYLLFTPSLMYAGDFEKNNTCACTEEEREALKEHFAGYTFSEKVKTLKRLSSHGSLDEPETFRQLRALFCHLGMHKQWQNDHYWVIAWDDLRDKTFSEGYYENNLLKSAIKSDSKDLVRFLYNNYFYDYYFKEYEERVSFEDPVIQPQGNFQLMEHRHPLNDLEMLLENLDEHKDPKGMLELLLSYRNKQVKFPQRHIPGECEDDSLSCGSKCRNRHGWFNCLSKKYSAKNASGRQFCTLIQAKVNQHDREVQSSLSNKLKNATKRKESEVK